jgi:hypothetical protein
VGGAVLVVIVLVLICGLGIFVVRKQAQNQRAARASADPTSFTGNTGGAKGKYDAAKVSNLCDKIDAKPVRDALPTATEQRPAEHRESRNDYFSSLSCSLSGRAPATARDYSSYSLNVSATYSDTEQSAERVFNSSKEYAAGRTGTGHTYGTISDLGKDAYFESESGSSYNSCTIVLYDSNVSLRIDVGASGKATTAEQLKALLTGVAKTSVANLR